MAMIFTSPSKYVQGAHVLTEISQYAAPLGHKFFVILSTSGEKRVGHIIRDSFASAGKEVVFAIFNQECCRAEINRLLTLCQGSGCDCVIGVGGGKIIDTAKVVAKESGSTIMIVPTIAATDAPCSAAAVIYTEEGLVSEFSSMSSNPHLVLVDSAIIAKAGSRLLVSGMGDALATYFEAQAVWDAGKDNVVGGIPTITGLALAKLCYDTLLAEGYKAKCAVSCGCLTPAVEKIIEANTLLSGLGFESGGLAAAHSIHNGLCALPETHQMYHGEKVAFSTIAQLVLANAPLATLDEAIHFCITVGLPVTLAELGVTEVTPEKIRLVAQTATLPGESIHNMPFPVDTTKVADAILTADCLGRNHH